MKRDGTHIAAKDVIVASFRRRGETFVFRFEPTRHGRAALYDALDDHVRHGMLTDEDVRTILLGLAQQPSNQHRGLT